jgi:outer membrane protein TolC
MQRARIAFLLALAGCTHFEPKPLDMARTAADFEARALDTPELRNFVETNLGPVTTWPLQRWNFEQLTFAALFLHPRLDVARAEVASARAAQITAGAQPNPTVGVTPEYTFNPADAVSPWIATIQFDLPIETAGKRAYRITKARQLSKAARLRLDSVAWEVRSAVRAAWLDLHEAEQRASLLARQLDVQQRLLAALETKLSLGALTTGEVIPARLACARTRKEISDARVQADEARARLAAAVGVPLKSLPPLSVLSDEVKTDVSFASAEARHRALVSRTDLLAALADYVAADTTLKLEIAKQYPDVHLGTGYQFDQGENKWALGLTVEIPVLNRNQGPIAEAEAKRAGAAARVLALQARIIGDVDHALAVWQGAQSRLAALAEVRAEQEARVKSLQAQLDAGALELLDLLGAEVELAAGQLLHWDAKLKALRAVGELEDTIQFPLPLDLSLNSRHSKP